MHIVNLKHAYCARCARVLASINYTCKIISLQLRKVPKATPPSKNMYYFRKLAESFVGSDQDGHIAVPERKDDKFTKDGWLLLGAKRSADNISGSASSKN